MCRLYSYVIYFITGRLYLLIQFTDFVYSPPSLSSGNQLFLFIYGSVYVLFSLFIYFDF